MLGALNKYFSFDLLRLIWRQVISHGISNVSLGEKPNVFLRTASLGSEVQKLDILARHRNVLFFSLYQLSV